MSSDHDTNARVTGIHPAGLTIAVLMLMLGVAGALSGELSIGVLAIAVALVSFGFALPTHLLPAAALVCFAFLPTSYLNMEFGRLRGVVTPAVVFVVIWGLKLIGSKAERKTSRGLIFLNGAVSVVLLLLSYTGTDFSGSLMWVMSAFFAVILPNLLHDRIDAQTVRVLWKTWVWVGLILALYALVESLSGFNPLAGIYTVEQKWSVYRVTTTIGHPLMNGMFFAVTALALGLGAIRRRDKLAGFAALLCVISTALTGARSGVLAFAAGLALWLMLSALSSRTNFTTKLIGAVFALVTAALILSNDTFRERMLSPEALGSAQYRDVYGIGHAWDLFAQNPLLGTGPGTSLYIIADATGFVLENAVVGTLVSLGVVGAGALILILLVLVVRALKRPSFEVVAALAAYLVAGYAFPLWETRPSAFVVVAFLVVLSAHTPSPRRKTPPDSAPVSHSRLSAEV